MTHVDGGEAQEVGDRHPERHERERPRRVEQRCSPADVDLVVLRPVGWQHPVGHDAWSRGAPHEVVDERARPPRCRRGSRRSAGSRTRRAWSSTASSAALRGGLLLREGHEVAPGEEAAERDLVVVDVLARGRPRRGTTIGRRPAARVSMIAAGAARGRRRRSQCASSVSNCSGRRNGDGLGVLDRARVAVLHEEPDVGVRRTHASTQSIRRSKRWWSVPTVTNTSGA